jgi:predicted phosphoribosyltransferase
VRQGRRSQWMPVVGGMATYAGRTAAGRRNVRIIAEASAGRMLVEAIGRKGVPVQFTVKRENLAPMQPGLFD